MPADLRQRLRRRGAWSRELGRLVRFGGVGLLSTLTYAVTSLLLADRLGAAPILASSVGVSASFCVSYVGHRAVSFRVAPDHRAYLPRFLVAAATAYLAQLAIMATVTGPLGLPYGVGVAAVVATIPLATYLVNRLWVFGPGLRRQP